MSAAAVTVAARPVRLLILDAYDAPGRDALSQHSVTDAGTLYRRLFLTLQPDAQITVVPTNTAADLTALSGRLGDFDGVVWTGSSLSVYDPRPLVRAQLDLVRATFRAGIPAFGSCYAAQLAALAAGGKVEPNPRGREFGIARKVALTPEGAAHPMFHGKPRVFGGFASHNDHITALPPDSTHLATNAFSPVQALAVTHDGGTFWAVQYHPEFNTREMARIAYARRAALTDLGYFVTPGDVDRFVRDWERLTEAPSPHLAFAYGLDDDVLDFHTRTLEARNWLQHMVLPRTG